MRRLVLVTALAALACPAGLRAQAVAPEEASDFLGNWAVTVEGPQGSIDINADIVDADGVLEASVQGPDGGMTFVDDVSLDGSTLTLSYEIDLGGQALPLNLMLEPNGTGLDATLSGADGQFTAAGSASLR